LLELKLKLNQQKEYAGLIWGEGRLRVNGLLVIAGEDDRPVAWTWVDLLEWLAKNWAYILLEQSFPFQVPAMDISTLMRDLEKRWENMAGDRVEDEEEEAFRFLGRHDLASAFKGIFFPAIYLMRQGNLMEAISAEHGSTMRLPLQRAVSDLEQIGDHLAELAATNEESRGKLAAQRWYSRGKSLKTKALPLLTGLSAGTLAQLNPENDPEYWEYNPEFPLADGELMAAARMTSGVLLADQQAQVLQLIRDIGKAPTPKLDSLSSDLAAVFKDIGKPYDQGYWAAIWLRRKLGIPASESVKPGELLESWDVPVREFHLPDSTLDALACWGPRRGPAIFVNKAQESTPAHVHGENTTLAHEICHLLLDRDGPLPVAEVLNGNTPERLEKRARAFAAELLLPRSVAVETVRTMNSLDAAVMRLSSTYEVSMELVSWQIINSDSYVLLADDEQKWLQSRAQRKAQAGT
tara:strand:+ start:78 stop:1472 length:1395 start_codon:yes stop_codon:yes gene_type:complete